MTEPLTFLLCDEQTDMQPPCEITACEPAAAVWLARFRCPFCGHQPWQLMCDRHFDFFITRSPARCTGCDRRDVVDYTLVTAERL